VADKFRSMLAARRRFASKPASKSSLPLPDGVDGAYFPDERMAVWDDAMPPDMIRQTRRHEAMHGIRDMVMQDPELRAAIPWWARRGKAGGFEDELLARLAGKDVMDWPMSQYFMDDPLKYGAALPFYAAARNPEGLLAGAVGTGATLAYALSGEEEKPPQEEIARRFDNLIGRLDGKSP